MVTKKFKYFLLLKPAQIYKKTTPSCFQYLAIRLSWKVSKSSNPTIPRLFIKGDITRIQSKFLVTNYMYAKRKKTKYRNVVLFSQDFQSSIKFCFPASGESEILRQETKREQTWLKVFIFSCSCSVELFGYDLTCEDPTSLTRCELCYFVQSERAF